MTAGHGSGKQAIEQTLMQILLLKEHYWYTAVPDDTNAERRYVYTAVPDDTNAKRPSRQSKHLRLCEQRRSPQWPHAEVRHRQTSERSMGSNMQRLLLPTIGP